MCICCQVAGFIFGGNVKDDKIEMTSPVISEANGEGKTKAEGPPKGEKIAMTSPVTTDIEGGK